VIGSDVGRILAAAARATNASKTNVSGNRIVCMLRPLPQNKAAGVHAIWRNYAIKVAAQNDRANRTLTPVAHFGGFLHRNEWSPDETAS
jgi:hypothetical protein